MKTLRLTSAPTRSRRLNEILGIIVLVTAGLYLLALASYTPTDPSFNSVGGYAVGRAAHNWVGLLGAWIADANLQVLGVAAFFLPLVLVRLGVCWMRSRPAGAPTAKFVGLSLWVIFAPAALALLPGKLLWRGALPVAGLSGRIVSDALVNLLNVPGTVIVVAAAVVISLYLATTFTFVAAREWATAHFGFIASMQARWNRWQAKRRGQAAEDELEVVDDHGVVYGAKREKLAAEAEKERRRAEKAAARANGDSNTLLSGLFGWLSRRKSVPVSIVPEMAERTPGSMWEAMPRVDVDAPAVTPLSTAAAAAAPYAEALAAAAAPVVHGDEPMLTHRGKQSDEEPFAFLTRKPEPAPMAPVTEMPRRVPKAKAEEAYAAPVVSDAPAFAAGFEAAQAAAAAQAGSISFGKRADTEQKAVAITAKSVRGYRLPSSSLLYRSEEQAVVREEALRDEARVLVEKCAEFGVDGQVTQINPGPVVTTFEFRPDAGVKYSRVTGLADDLCLAMAAESILIERMPGKSTVGIQVPNADRETIWLRDVVECESFAQSKSKLAIALGKDINGRIVTADLASMPHVLIAGSTGSGKSVAINAMIMSVLFKSTPEQVRMILVDPKRVELGMYEGIPHLFTPIITEAKLAANALRNAVREMERRLKLLAANHVRNIDQFNKLFDHGSEYLFEDVNQEPLPYIIIIIDELADLMMLDRSNVEESITRLAQMARAVGIHLILATQRPSVDVITGLIKANVPTRMSFRLATKVDSRTIIDSNGAESLLGRGDMLYLPPGTSRLSRVHAPFVTEKEISAVTAFWRAQGEAEYVQGFLEGPKDEKDGGEEMDGSAEGDNDPMFDDAVRLVFEFGKASTSLLQRRLRIGYGRAAHLIDLMHRDGLVGPAEGSKPREILKSPDFYKEIDAAMR
jgi:S-DNA-T family DNA segregation ATPase FtsK/SpoIIIE